MVRSILQERRRSQRSSRIVSVRHRLYKRSQKTFKSEWFLTASDNISLTGLHFCSAFEYKADDLIELQISMSGTWDIFRGFGKVVRVNRKENAAFYCLAIDYKDVKPRPKTKPTMSTRGAHVKKTKAKSKRI